jgi:hypothetical protein
MTSMRIMITKNLFKNDRDSIFIIVTTLADHERAVQNIQQDDTYNLLPRIFDCVKIQFFNGEEVIIVSGGETKDCVYYGGLDSYDVIHYHPDFMNDVVVPLWQGYKNNLSDFIEFYT